MLLGKTKSSCSKTVRSRGRNRCESADAADDGAQVGPRQRALASRFVDMRERHHSCTRHHAFSPGRCPEGRRKTTSRCSPLAFSARCLQPWVFSWLSFRFWGFRDLAGLISSTVKHGSRSPRVSRCMETPSFEIRPYGSASFPGEADSPSATTAFHIPSWVPSRFC